MAGIDAKQMRVVVHVDDFDEAVRFYRDGLGLVEAEAYSGPGGAEVMILDVGRATLELANSEQVSYIDEVEVGARVAPRIRIAIEVTDARSATETAATAGARVIVPPVETPWRSLNSRLDAVAGLQLTLFQELGAE
jgi:lactoylglutathione lyase